MPIIPKLLSRNYSATRLSRTSLRKSQRNKRASYDSLEPRQLLAALPIINEFLASNSSGLVDDNGKTTDWIELYNAGDQSVDLAGYSLTDDSGDPSKYVFPGRTLLAGQYLVVFAGDDADPLVGSGLFTGFGLRSSGEYLGLYGTTGTLLSEFSAGGSDYPAQISDVSYGYLADGTYSQPSYFATPTPGAANLDPVAGIVERVSSSVTPGFFDTSISVVLSTPTSGATIRYTTDGSTPSATNGTTYSSPIAIDSTTNLRALSSKTNFLSVPDRTWTYLFLDDVVTQSNNGSAPAGFPSTWGSNVVDYGIDPDVITVEGAQEVRDALLAIPTWSITTDIDNLFDESIGIYSNAENDGIDWEQWTQPSKANICFTTIAGLISTLLPLTQMTILQS